MTKFFNKLLFTVLYYILFRVVYALFLPILSNGYLSALIGILSVSAACRALRIADIKKANYYQEIRDEYNKSLKNKFNFIVKSKDIKFEIVFALLVAIYVPVRFAIRIIMESAIPNIPFMILLGVVIFIGIVVADIIIWFLAYNANFRKKEY